MVQVVDVDKTEILLSKFIQRVSQRRDGEIGEWEGGGERKRRERERKNVMKHLVRQVCSSFREKNKQDYLITRFQHFKNKNKQFSHIDDMEKLFMLI